MAQPNDIDRQATELAARLAPGPRIGIIGGTRMTHPGSEDICRQIGRRLAAMPDQTLLTGGVAGIGDTIGRAYFQTRRDIGMRGEVVHLLPQGVVGPDYGRTETAGTDMSTRREILGRLAGVYVAVEGGAGTAHECRIADANGALIVPVGATGGAAAASYAGRQCPAACPEGDWRMIGDAASPPLAVAAATVGIVATLLVLQGPEADFDPYRFARHRDIRNRLARAFTSALDRESDEPLNRFRDRLPRRIPPAVAATIDHRCRVYSRAITRARQRPAGAAVPRFALLWNMGLYFEAHEMLETRWRLTQGDLREALKGLVQAAGAMALWQMGRRPAAARLAARAGRHLRGHAAELSTLANLDELASMMSGDSPLAPMPLIVTPAALAAPAPAEHPDARIQHPPADTPR